MSRGSLSKESVSSVSGKDGIVVLDKNDVGLSNVDNVQQLPLSQKGVVSGVATLDAAGKVPNTQIPTSPQNYLGAYNILTNTPVVVDGVGTNGDYYKCSISGSRNFGSGVVTVAAGDSLIYGGAIWEKIPSSDLVQSVSGKVGIVVLDTDDVDESWNLYYTEERVSANSDVSSNIAHRSSDGKNHSDVVLNNSHRQVVVGNPHVVTKTEVGLSNLDNVQQIPLSQKGIANGVPSLDAASRIPSSQLPTTVTEYKGSYNIVTNTPELIDGIGTNGDFYKNSISGSRNFGSGIVTVVAGDAFIYSGTLSIWEKIPGEDLVQSVAGKMGIVVLDTDDISEATNLYHTSDRVENHIFETLKLLNAPENVLSWNSADLTIDIKTGLGPVLQVGQEMFDIVYNGTGSQIDNGSAVYPVGTFGGRPSVSLSNSIDHRKISGDSAIATMDIPDSSFGIVTKRGSVRDLDTSMWPVNTILWISCTVDGGLINVRPPFPNYAVRVGKVFVSDAENGVIKVDIKGEPVDTVINFWNGVFRESINFTVSSDGATVAGSLVPGNGHDDMTMMFSDGFTILDTNPAKTIVLTPGSASIPQSNYVYIPKTTKILTVSTSDWPTDEHIKVAYIVLKTALLTQSEGSLRNQNWNDSLENTTTHQGHLSHMGERMRQMDSKWENGIQGSATGFPSNVYVEVTSGQVYQMHKQTFLAQSMPTNRIHVVNDPATPYAAVNNLNGQVLDSLGVTLANSSFSFVVWGVQNKTAQQSHLMCNLPSGKYAKNSPDLAVADSFNFSVYNIPKQFQGVGFLIARFTFTLDAGGTVWELYDTEDLRGYVPNTTAGGGGGGGVATSWLGLTDTPSGYTGHKGRTPFVNETETALEFVSLKSGTLVSPPAGLFIGEHWEDSTDSLDHPIIRVSKVIT